MVEPFAAVDVIKAKRDRHELTPQQIDWVVDAYTRGVVADEQMSALAMAILINGMTDPEIVRWTTAMINTGVRMDFSSLPRPTVDKHSTGGVGDKITLPLVPVVAACGAAVPQLSGRGLGHTGGTLDKLESIPGWRAALSNDEMMQVLRDVGGVICAAGEGLAPADKKLYALRDVTGTVEAIPLIASSIMSKKIAEGAGGLVLDVKTGSGAFMPDPAQARGAGRDDGPPRQRRRRRDARPHHRDGRAARHSRWATPSRSQESVDVLAGGGPCRRRGAHHRCWRREMLDLAGLPTSTRRETLVDGSAMDVWKRMIRAQGGDPDAPLPVARESEVVRADVGGVVSRLDALSVGIAAWRLGAGRARKEDPVSAGAGITAACQARRRRGGGRPAHDPVHR